MTGLSETHGHVTWCGCVYYSAEVTKIMTTHFPTIYKEGDNLLCKTCMTITFRIKWMGVCFISVLLCSIVVTVHCSQ